MNLKLSDLWRWNGTIDRTRYLIWGAVLFCLKYNLDHVISWLVFHKPWSPLDYLRPDIPIAPTNSDLHQFITILALSLPFLWLGMLLTLWRLRAARLPRWMIILFVVPFVKFLFFALLCLLPSKEADEATVPRSRRWRSWLAKVIPNNPFGSAVMAISITLLMSVPLVWFGTEVMQKYGWPLFVGVPFCMGLYSVLIYSYHGPRSYGQCLAVAFYTVMLAGLALLLFALEGVICLIMAAPLAIGMALIGGTVGYAIQQAASHSSHPPKLYCPVLVLIPLAMCIERGERLAPPLMKVTSSVEISAPTEMVWRHVLSFSELPPPHEWLFCCGIAYPTHAEIHGHGVGAIRHCNFTTGPFVEPIEVWDEPNLLKFSVTKNPAPMKELSPYQNLNPPHLTGFLVSREGQFRLIQLPNGHTLLEGTTWYHHNLWPAQYWQFWSDYIIHTIHMRVLNHVKHLAESEQIQK